MKKLVSVLLCVTLAFSLGACGCQSSSKDMEKASDAPIEATTAQLLPPTISETALDSIETLRTFIVENGTTYGDISMYEFDTPYDNIELLGLFQKGTVLLMLRDLTSDSAPNSSLYFGRFEGQKDDHYLIYTLSDAGKGRFQFRPSLFTATSPVASEDFTSETNYPLDSFNADISDATHTILELFAFVLEDNNLNLTLADFDLVQYEPDVSRPSKLLGR